MVIQIISIIFQEIKKRIQIDIKKIQPASISVFFTALLSLLVNDALSQSSGHLMDASLSQFYPYTVIHYSNKSGLPANQMHGIVQGEKGSIILGTSNGIVTFNGSQFKLLVPDNRYSGDRYNNFYWVDDYKMLLGVSSNNRLFLLFPRFRELGDFNCMAVIKDSLMAINDSGEVWVAGKNDLKFQKKWHSGIRGARSIILSEGYLYIAAKTGLWRIKPGKPTGSLITEGPCKCIYKSSYDKKLYLLTNRAFFRIEENKAQTVFDLGKHDTITILTSAAILGAEDFFIGSSKGIYRVFPEYVDHYNEDNILPAGRIQSLCYDTTSGCLFAATVEKGLLQFIAKTCRTMPGKDQFKKGGSVGSIVRTQQEETIMTEVGGCLYKLRPSTVEPYGPEQGSFASLSEIDGILYVGTWGGGIKLFRERSFIGRIVGPKQLPDNVVFATFKDSHGTIWVGTKNGVARGRDSLSIRPFMQDKLTEMVTVFYECKNGNICMGATGRFVIMSPQGNIVADFGKTDGLKCRTVRSFYEDREGKLWIGTYDGGLYCLHRGKLTSINAMANCMLDADAFCLAPDGLGYLYMTSNHGLWKVKEQDLNDFYYGRLQYLIPYYYGEESGIQNTEFNGGFQNNYFLSPYGHFYFPSISGLVVAVPEAEHDISPEISIEKVTVNDTAFRGTTSVLKRNTFSVGFDFTAQSFTEENNLYYQFRLNSIGHSEWSGLQKKGSISFKLLPPGTYTFEVRALDAKNPRYPNAAQFVFTIDQNIYETFWFRAMGVSGLSLLIFFFTYTYVQRSRKRTFEREKIKRQVAELELKAVESQMNPHFVFNSLNSIKYYLTVNNIAMADRCLDHLSKLLRDFLEHGAHDFISAGKEAEILNSYLELEKQRINPPFDFNIQLPAELSDVKIPTHLLQPLVENAVKHGISHSSHKGLLIVKFQQSDGNIRLIVEDNGIGRARAAGISRALGTSKGLAIVKEKIRLVKELYNIAIIFTISDLTNNNNVPSGTRVELIIPINQGRKI